MIAWNTFTTTKEEYETISKIVNRSTNYIIADRLSLMMDIECAHNQYPLDLNGLLNANESDFFHDIIGIRNNINRKNGKIENCFVPRYALNQ